MVCFGPRMPPPLELLYGLCATSLIGYLVGRPFGAGGPARGRRVRFLLAGALAAGGALIAAGWPPLPALVLALVGAGLTIGLDDLVTRQRAVAVRPVYDDEEAGGEPEDHRPAEPSVRLPRREPEPAARSLGPKVGKKPKPNVVPVEPTQAHGMAPGPEASAVDMTMPLGKTVSPKKIRKRPSADSTEPVDDIDLEKMFDEVDAALSVSPDACPHCQGQNLAHARFCKHCSAPLKPWRCGRCSRVNDIDASFCIRCSEPIQLLASPLDVQVVDE